MAGRSEVRQNGGHTVQTHIVDIELGLEATDFAKTSVTLICMLWECEVVVDGVSWGITDVI